MSVADELTVLDLPRSAISAAHVARADAALAIDLTGTMAGDIAIAQLAAGHHAVGAYRCMAIAHVMAVDVAAATAPDRAVTRVVAGVFATGSAERAAEIDVVALGDAAGLGALIDAAPGLCARTRHPRAAAAFVIPAFHEQERQKKSGRQRQLRGCSACARHRRRCYSALLPVTIAIPTAALTLWGRSAKQAHIPALAMLRALS